MGIWGGVGTAAEADRGVGRHIDKRDFKGRPAGDAVFVRGAVTGRPGERALADLVADRDIAHQVVGDVLAQIGQRLAARDDDIRLQAPALEPGALDGADAGQRSVSDGRVSIVIAEHRRAAVEAG